MAKYDEPVYEIITSDNTIEIREYKPMLVAQVLISGERKPAIRTGFRLLADYIFGNNESQLAANNDSEKIKMTAPVIQQLNQKMAMTAPVLQQMKGGDWLVEFVMPKDFTLNTLPKPINPQVKIREVAGHQAVVIRFSGTASEKNLRSHLAQLIDYVAERNLKSVGDPIYAFYNPPWTLPFFRRNEIMFEIKQKK